MAQFVITPGVRSQFYDARGNALVDTRLLSVLQAAAAQAPGSVSKVEAFSGRAARSTGTFNHPRGWAVDVKLYDQNGQPLADYAGNPFGVRSADAKAAYPIYEQFAQTARAIQQDQYPDLADQFRWGGYFTGGVNPGDLMHFDISGGKSAATPPMPGAWQNGIGNGLTVGAAALNGVVAAPAARNHGGVTPEAQSVYQLLTQGDPAHGVAPLSPAVAAGAVGNMMQESYQNLRPDAKGAAGELGIGQWMPDRYANMVAWTKANGLDPASREGQALFYSHELQASPVMADLANAQTPGDAAQIIASKFERAGNPMMDRRVGFADAVAGSAVGGAPDDPQVAAADDAQPDIMFGDTPAWITTDQSAAPTAAPVASPSPAPAATAAVTPPVVAAPSENAKVIKASYSAGAAKPTADTKVAPLPPPAPLASPTASSDQLAGTAGALGVQSPAAVASPSGVSVSRPPAVNTGNALGDRMLNAILSQNPLELAAIGNDYTSGNPVTFGAPGTQNMHGLAAMTAVKGYLDANPSVASQVKGILQSDPMTSDARSSMGQLVGELPGKATPPSIPLTSAQPTVLPTPRPAHESTEPATQGGANAWAPRAEDDTFLGGSGSFLSGGGAPAKTSGASAWQPSGITPYVSAPATPYPKTEAAPASVSAGTPSDLGKALAGLSLGGFGATVPYPAPDQATDPLAGAEVIPTVAGHVSFTAPVQKASLTQVLANPKPAAKAGAYKGVSPALASGSGFGARPPSGLNAWGLPGSVMSAISAANKAGYSTTPTSLLSSLAGQGYSMPNFSSGSGGSVYATNRNVGGTTTDVHGNSVNVGTYYNSQGKPVTYTWSDNGAA